MSKLQGEVESYWQYKKDIIIDNIDLTIKRNKVDKDVLELMKHIVEKAKIRIIFKDKEEI